MDYVEFQNMVSASPSRLLRYYACAVAKQVAQVGKTSSIERAIGFGERMAVGQTNWSKNYEIRKLHTQLTKLANNQENFQSRTAREVAVICIDPHIVKSHFATVINAVRHFMGRNFDDEIASCIRPTYDRKSVGTKRDYVRAMVHRMYDEGDWLVGRVLADACEEANLLDQEAWDHLRGCCHYRGCWVLEDILGIWGSGNE